MIPSYFGAAANPAYNRSADASHGHSHGDENSHSHSHGGDAPAYSNHGSELPTHSHSHGGKPCTGHGRSSDGISSFKWKLFVAFVIVVVLMFVFRTKHTHPMEPHLETVMKSRHESQMCYNHVNTSQAVLVSWSPRIFIYPHFLTDEECDYMIAKGNNQGLSRSLVAASPGTQPMSEARTSYGTFLKNDRDPILNEIEWRISKWTRLPIENGENFYLLRYEVGQEYKPHHDYFHEEVEGMDKYIGPAGQRTATVLIYLSTPEEGGETSFPLAGLKVPAVKGTAVLFWSHRTDGVLDERSLHGSVPVVRGTKYCMTKWIRLKNYPNRF